MPPQGTHVAPEQTFAPLHAPPPQHGCPLSPHGGGAVSAAFWHFEAVQAKPALHAPPPQQSCPSSPQGATASGFTHAPALHESDGAQRPPSQHGVSSTPHPSVGKIPSPTAMSSVESPVVASPYSDETSSMFFVEQLASAAIAARTRNGVRGFLIRSKCSFFYPHPARDYGGGDG